MDIYKKEDSWVVTINPYDPYDEAKHEFIIDTVKEILTELNISYPDTFMNHFKGEIQEPYYEGPVDLITFTLPTTYLEQQMKNLKSMFQSRCGRPKPAPLERTLEAEGTQLTLQELFDFIRDLKEDGYCLSDVKVSHVEFGGITKSDKITFTKNTLYIEGR